MFFPKKGMPSCAAQDKTYLISTVYNLKKISPIEKVRDAANDDLFVHFFPTRLLLLPFLHLSENLFSGGKRRRVSGRSAGRVHPPVPGVRVQLQRRGQPDQDQQRSPGAAPR